MRIAIMQPYFFRYLGQFQLIHLTDRFILCDDVQYIRHGWINRNRILTGNGEYQYIIVPLASHSSKTPIKQIQLAGGSGWKETILRQLACYRKKAPYFERVYQLLTECLSPDETNITKLNGNCLQAVCEYIGLPFTLEISSELGLDYTNVHTTGDWALRICEQLGATAYFNPPGGIELYDKEIFHRHNIQLHFVKPVLKPYSQFNNSFLPGLSVIDIMMFNDPSAIKEMLNDYQLL
jgi:hypothetical protein